MFVVFNVVMYWRIDSVVLQTGLLSQHLAKLTVDASTKGSNWENRRRSEINKMNLNPAVRARWLANLGGVVLVTVIKEVDPKLLPFLTFARCQEPSLWTTTGWPAKHCNSHFVQRQTTNTVIGSPSPSPFPPRMLSFNSQRHPPKRRIC